MNTELPAEDDTDPPGRLGKPELVETVAEAIDIDRTEADRIVEALFDSIVRALNRGEVQIRGFGSFGVRERSARIGRNPKTGTPVAVPPKRVAFFALSKRFLKDFNRT